MQPWHVVVLTGESLARFRAALKERREREPTPDPQEYGIYPESLKAPYRDYRFELTEMMYATMGIAREDKPARLAHVARNFDFFGAPAAMFCFIDRQMGPPQWSDLGMFLQSTMLLFTEAGVDTCAQEAWSRYSRFVPDHLGVPADWMLFCGMAIGYRDPEAPVNGLRSRRGAVVGVRVDPGLGRLVLRRVRGRGVCGAVGRREGVGALRAPTSLRGAGSRARAATRFASCGRCAQRVSTNYPMQRVS